MALAMLFPALLIGCQQAEPASAPAELEPTTVSVAEAKEGTLEAGLTLTGKVKGSVELALLPKASGRVARIAVAVGSRVKAGDLLVELDASDVEAQVRQAEAAVKAAEAGKESAEAQAEAQIAQAKQAVHQAEEGLKQAEKSLEAARNAHALAEKNVERVTKLKDDGLASEVDLEQAEQQEKQAATALQQAESARENAAKALEVARLNLKIAEERVGVKAATAQLEQARAGLASARHLLENMRITAPVGGVVAALPVAVGDMVGPQVAVATIVDMHPARVVVDLPEQAYDAVAVGQAVTVTAGDRSQTGTVKVKDLTPNPQTRAYRVEVEVPNDDGAFVSGMSVTVVFPPEGMKPVLLVPADAVLPSAEAGKGTVYVYEGGVVRERSVELGRQTKAVVEIRSGLQAGEKVVVKGQYLLKDGDRVRLADETAPTKAAP
ncbi:MAG: efflux RND transporter periplasmic adaptor subunit [Hydrogenibacillus schlegelii]|uniref:Efflux RND transporter periplasmic adaptor subunit n=1 Tax=Hydrogenibacillus schlegelii TaxID=1484 RepID=A0A947CV11_HYDSH|nr:efflux RND transporter periplasmic adaptor subunit [Hydrogenibacillus schlegelii]